LRTAAQPLTVFFRILKNVEDQADGVPHPNNRCPTPGQHAVPRRRKHRLRPLRFEPLPLLAQPVFQLPGQSVVRLEQRINLILCHRTLHMYPVKLSRSTAELSFPVRIQRDRLALATLDRYHINLNVPQRNVIHRLERALDQQNPAARALRHRGEKVIVATTHHRGAVAELDPPIHVHQRRQIRRVTDGVSGAAEPVIELLAIQRQGVGEVVECLLNACAVLHQRSASNAGEHTIGSNMGSPSRRKNGAGDCAGDQRGKKSGGGGVVGRKIR